MAPEQAALRRQCAPHRWYKREEHARGGRLRRGDTNMEAAAPAPAPAAALSEEEQFYASLGGRCRRGFFKDVAWDEACLATAIDAFRVPDRRCYVPDDCGPYEHRCPTIGSNCQSTVTMSKPVVHLFCLHALATLIRSGTPSDGRFRVLDVGSGTGFLTAALAALLDNEGVRGDVLGIDVEETPCAREGELRRGRPRFAREVPARGRVASAEEEGRVHVHLRGRVRAARLAAALCERLAPGGLLVVPVVATGTRRQAYLMIRRDPAGRLRRPETVCARALRAPDRHAGLRARDAGARDRRLLGRRGRPAHLREGRRRPLTSDGRRAFTARNRVSSMSGFGCRWSPACLRERERPRAAGPLRRAADVHRTGQGGDRRHGVSRRRLDGCGRRPGFSSRV